jgi:hypothetical protein
MPPAADRDASVDPQSVRVLEIRPLDEQQIETILERHAEELRASGATPSELLAFIHRTYDLEDLASRPLLLNLIIESVRIGGLSLRDADAQYGPSGLYEVYTDTKLDVDLTKGHPQHSGLSLNIRRDLAAHVALAMYETNVLELDFEALLDQLTDVGGPLHGVLESRQLTRDEIATDLATFSFITLDRDGRCRFIHKSFRSFFVARVLKTEKHANHPLFSERLEREVLYFLGGFSPTTPALRARLWNQFQQAPLGSVLRRNVLVAHLYTRPEHQWSAITDAEIGDADFGNLTFVGSRMERVRWHACDIRHLALRDVKWAEVAVDASTLRRLELRGSDAQLAIDASTLELIDATESRVRLSLTDCSLDVCLIDAGRLHLTGHRARIGQLSAARADISVDSGAAARVSISRLTIADGRLAVADPTSLRLEASRSAVVCQGPLDAITGWRLAACGVICEAERLEATAPESKKTPVERLLVDAETVFVCSGSVSAVLTRRRAGVFGGLGDPRTFKADAVACWGVLTANANDIDTVAGAEVARLGGMLLMTEPDYAEALRPGGRLSAVAALRDLLAREPDMMSHESADLRPLLEHVRAQFESLAGDWPSA